jgi:hypothetical protein
MNQNFNSEELEQIDSTKGVFKPKSISFDLGTILLNKFNPFSELDEKLLATKIADNIIAYMDAKIDQTKEEFKPKSFPFDLGSILLNNSYPFSVLNENEKIYISKIADIIETFIDAENDSVYRDLGKIVKSFNNGLFDGLAFLGFISLYVQIIIIQIGSFIYLFYITVIKLIVTIHERANNNKIPELDLNETRLEIIKEDLPTLLPTDCNFNY